MASLKFFPTCVVELGNFFKTYGFVKVWLLFLLLKVIWPNRGGGFGIAEIIDVSLDTPEARAYHSPHVIDNNIFFPMNWTFYLSCDRIRPQDCIFSPIPRYIKTLTNEVAKISLRCLLKTQFFTALSGGS